MYPSNHHSSCKLVRSPYPISNECFPVPECEHKCEVVNEHVCDIKQKKKCGIINEKSCKIVHETECSTFTEKDCTIFKDRECTTGNRKKAGISEGSIKGLDLFMLKKYDFLLT